MAPPQLGYRHGIWGEIDEIMDEWDETPGASLVLLVPKKSRRRHDREMKIRSRMRFAYECMWIFQPGVKYGVYSLADANEPMKQQYPRWFVPGRFAKIHPARVCSCEMCKGPRDWSKRERRKVRMQLRRDPENFFNERWTDWW